MKAKLFSFFFFFMASSLLFADSPLTLFKIDPAIRGPEISMIVTTYNSAPYLTVQSEVAIQAGRGFIYSPSFAPYVTGGFIPYVQSAAASANGTLLTITYLPSGASTRNQYLIVPIEKVTAVMYSTEYIPPSRIASSFQQGELQRFDIDPVLRAADLVTEFNNFNTGAIYQTGQNTIGIFISLKAPFDPPIFGGFIPNVQSITATGAYLSIVYLPYSLNGRTFNKTNAAIIVPAEQVVQMVYYPNRLYSPNGL